MSINSVEQIQAITGVSEKTAQGVYLEIGKRKQLKEPFLSDDERVLWEAFKEKLPENSPALTAEDPKAQSLERSAQSIAIDFKKYLKCFKSLVSIIGVCAILLVLLDSKFQFIQKGNYIEPQNPVYTPLTPDYGTNPYSYTVYVTARGEKYHKATCRYLTESQRDIDL